MSNSRIDHLRALVATIGAKQNEYHSYFPSFADRLKVEFGNYLDSPESVALCCAFGEFSFNGIYRYDGLGFEAGKYRVPLMVCLKNLKDDGDLLVRVRIYFTKEGSALSAHIDGEDSIQFRESDLNPLNEYIYHHLCNRFVQSAWFDQNRSEWYQTTTVGFTVEGTQ